ncbi:MAG: XcyI family restriction endonuclease [Deltaproteobacteria bacterium]|nr:XcyI family restriction endonuclease [Deltaproteobacteria bacterium]
MPGHCRPLPGNGREEKDLRHCRDVASAAVKSGTDAPNVRGRIGKAGKSLRKARLRRFAGRRAALDVNGPDPEKARGEPPSAGRFVSLAAIPLRAGEEHEDFRRPLAFSDGRYRRPCRPMTQSTP